MADIISPQSFLDSFQQHLLKIPRSAERRLLIAFSGGLDSTVLLHLSVQLVGSSRCRAVHINHGSSEHADLWERHCERVANSLSIEFSAHKINIEEGNFEGIARTKRLHIFNKILRRDEVLVTAHHADDFVETVIWQMLTGRAQIGIPRCRPLNTGFLLRPLLDRSKSELHDLAVANEWAWVEDESNMDLSMDRNWIRHQLVPDINRRFSGFTDRIRTIPKLFQTSYSYQPLDISQGSRTVAEISSWLNEAGVFPTSGAINEIAHQQAARADAKTKIRVSNELHVSRYDDYLHLIRTPLPPADSSIKAGDNVSYESGSLSWEATAGFLCPREYRIGVRIPGATIRTHGHAKKITKLMQEARIPPWQRDVWPVLYVGEQIAAVPNLAIADAFRQKSSSGWRPIWIPVEFSCESPTSDIE